MQRAYLRTLVSDEVIEEHKRQPFGQHSEPLERLLNHFRVMPIKGKYAIKRDEASDNFHIVALSGERGVAPRIVNDTRYETVEAAYHGVFLRQVEELMGA